MITTTGQEYQNHNNNNYFRPEHGKSHVIEHLGLVAGQSHAYTFVFRSRVHIK
jgi:hypothetical protein